MMRRNLEAELDAMKAVTNVLEPLTKAQRAAVLLSTILLLRLPGWEIGELQRLLRLARELDE